MLLDAGNLFIRGSKSSCDQKTLGKAGQTLKSYQNMAYDAINLSERDLVLGASFLQEKGTALKLPFISSNLISNKTGKPIFTPFIVKKAGQINVGVFGLMDQPLPSQKANNAYIVKNQNEAAREMISSLRGKADLIVALSSLPKEKNVKLLEDFSDIDFVISTDKRTHAPIRVKNGCILSSGDKGRHLGMLNIRLSSMNRPLGLQDLSKEGQIRSNLSWVREKIAKLKEKRENILKSDNASIKERFKLEFERLKNHEDKYQRKLAGLDKAQNYFKNKVIPLASKKPEMAAILSQKGKGKPTAKARTDVMSPGPHIKIIVLPAEKGEKVTFVLMIDKAPNQVRALGFDVVYNPKVLKYSNYEKGELVKKFDMFDASKLKDGLLRVGGFEAREDLIVPGKCGELVRLYFQLIGKGNLDLQLINLKDDISSWGVEDARYSDKQKSEDKSELEKIQKAIKEKGAKWEAGDTPVSDLSSEERKKRLGLKKKKVSP